MHDVVVAALVGPGAGRVVDRAARRRGRPRPVRSSIGRCDLLARTRPSAPRGVQQPQVDVADVLAHRAACIIALEVGRQVVRVGDDVDRCRAARRDRAAARPPANRCRRRGSRTGTRPRQRSSAAVEVLRRLALVLAVGEQDGVADGARRRRRTSRRPPSATADRGAAARRASTAHRSPWPRSGSTPMAVDQLVRRSGRPRRASECPAITAEERRRRGGSRSPPRWPPGRP